MIINTVRVFYYPPFTLLAFLNRFNPVILGLYTTRGTDEVTVSGDYNPPRLVQVPSKGNMWYVSITKPLALQSGSNKQIKKSTRTTDRREAEKRVNKIVTTMYTLFDDSLSQPKSFYEIADKLLARRGINLDQLRQKTPDNELPDQSSLLMY